MTVPMMICDDSKSECYYRGEKQKKKPHLQLHEVLETTRGEKMLDLVALRGALRVLLPDVHGLGLLLALIRSHEALPAGASNTEEAHRLGPVFFVAEEGTDIGARCGLEDRSPASTKKIP